VNAVYRPQQAQVSLPAPDYARRLVGWGDVSGDCGRGVPVGLVDTGIDGALAAFAGRDIVRRCSRRRRRAGAGRARHGGGQPSVGGNDAATMPVAGSELHLPRRSNRTPTETGGQRNRRRRRARLATEACADDQPQPVGRRQPLMRIAVHRRGASAARSCH
jgi:hypothetical protein